MPEGVLDINRMYEFWQNLVNAGSISSTVISCNTMFSHCIRLKESAIFDPASECSRWLMYYCCAGLEKAYDVACTKQTEVMYASCFNLRLSDDQIAELSSVDLVAKTFINYTGLLKHYFIPILLVDAFDCIEYFYSRRLRSEGASRDSTVFFCILPFTDYGLLPDYSGGDLLKLTIGKLPFKLYHQTVEDTIKQQMKLYRKPNFVRASKDSTYAKGVNAFL